MSQIRRIAWIGGSGLLLLAIVIAIRKYRGQQRLFFPERERVESPASRSNLPKASDVRFQSRGVDLSGWYVPSTNRAAVILTHGAGATRANVLAEARALTQAGFGVLSFDWPGHGASSGSIHWAEGERASLTAAIDWLEARPEVDKNRLGAYGFSMGGYVVTQVAASDSRLKAVVLAGTPADQREQVRFQHGKYWLLGELPALYALKRGGMHVDSLKPIDEIQKISPRSVLLIGGSEDVIVPVRMARELFEKAGEPKEVYIIEDAGHGDYVEKAGSAYLGRLVNFFEKSLLANAG